MTDNRKYDIMSEGDNMGSIVNSEPVFAKINESGRVLIPVSIRKEMNLNAGDDLLMEVEDGVLRIESYRARIRRIQEEFRQFTKPGVLASDQLIAERRDEARREREEGIG
jgi:AbrB family looped-hinge helix DNA binding protein